MVVTQVPTFAVSDFLEACEDEVERGQIDFK